jgi:hypothetical protein
MAMLTGQTMASLAGHQILVDRRGWMRALARPGQADWSLDNLICSSKEQAQPSRETGMGALLKAIDADPVLDLRGAFPH